MKRKGRSSELSGLFDWLKSKKKPPPKTNLPVLRREDFSPRPEAPKKSVFDAIPEKGSVPSVFDGLIERAASIFKKTDQPGLLQPYIEKAEQVFAPIPPSPPQEVSHEPIIKESEEVPEELFRSIRPSTPARAERGHPYPPDEEALTSTGRPAHADWPLGKPPRYWGSKWRPQTAYEMAYDLQQGQWLDLVGIFEEVLSIIYLEWWTTAVEASAHTGEEARYELMQVANWQRVYDDLAQFFQIPKYVFGLYFDSPRDDEENAFEFHKEVIEPLQDNFSKAMEAIRPRPLRGWFEISESDDGDWWLKYVEGKQTTGSYS